MVQVSKVRQVREGSFGYLLQVLTRRIDAEMKEKLQEIGIDSRILANLMMLSEEDGINQRQLGEKLGFPEYHTSRNVDALIEAGYAIRQPDPNSRRSTLIFLTDLGRETAQGLPKLIQGVNGGFLDMLSKAERETLIGLLQKVVGITPA